MRNGAATSAPIGLEGRRPALRSVGGGAGPITARYDRVGARAAARGRRSAAPAIDGPFRARVAAPALRPTTVPRQRLLLRIAEATEPAVILTAPAGYGKTTLLAQWAACDPRAVRWLSLEGSCEPGQLVRAVHFALARVGSFDDRLASDLAVPGRDVAPESVRRLLDGVEGAVPFLLVLDGVEALADTESLDLLAELATSVPAGATLALAGRRPLGGPVASLRATGVATDLDASELAMTRRELAAALGSMGVHLAEADLDRVAARTEGWPAAVHLAALILRSREGAARGAAGLSGASAPIAEYLAREVLEGQPRRTREMLLRTAILERVSPSLAILMTGDQAAGEDLRHLPDAGLPAVPLDSRGDWVRVHPLLRELLLAQLSRATSAIEPALHLLASRWHMERGMPDEAFAHALDAGDALAAGRIFASHLFRLDGTGRRSTLLRWRAAFSAQDAMADPSLAIAIAWHDGMEGAGDADRFMTIAAIADARESAAPTGFSSLDSALAGWRAAFGRGGADEMRADARSFHSAEPADSPLRAMSCALLGAALLVEGEWDDAAEPLREAQMIVPLCHAALEQLVLALLAYRDLRTGRREAATSSASLAISVIADAGLRDTTSSALAFATMAALLAEGGDGVGAVAQLKAAARLLDRSEGWPWLGIMVSLLSARAHRLLGKDEDALAHLARCHAILARWPCDTALARDVADEEAALDAPLAAGQHDEAQPAAAQLSAAETKVLRMLASARSLREIAVATFVSRNTVKTHVARIYRKLGVTSRSGAVERARILGLLEG